ncbi:MAG: porin [Acidobacteriota bacterium]
MKRTLATVALFTLVAILPAPARAVELVQTQTMSLHLDGYLQALGVVQHVPDRSRNTDRVYLFLKEARLRFTGNVETVKYEVMLAPGAEDSTPNTNSALGLLDFNFDVPLAGGFDVKVGQFLVPYGRERITTDSTMSFGDRSIENLGFAWNRDYGLALSHYRGKMVGTVAVMSGGGRDVPQRYLPEKLGSPLVVGRFGYNDGIDKDIYHVSARDLEPTRAKSAFYLNALYLKDSSIGHSTVLNVRASDKNLLINSNYNPYITKAPSSLGRVWQVGGDAEYQAPMSFGAFTAEAQVDFSHFDNKYGNLSLKGGRLQAGITRDKWEANLRYAILYLDKKMAYVNAGVSNPILTSDKPLQEITPSVTYHYKPNVILVADFPYLIDMLVFQENTIGSYVMSEHPEQVSVIKPGTTAGTGRVIRHNVPEARLLIQLSF